MEVQYLMTTPTRSLWPGTSLGTITRFGHDFTVIAEGTDGLVLAKANGQGKPHRTGLLTWDAARDTFTAKWHPDAYPRVESDSLLAIGLVKAARLLHHRIHLGEPLPDDSGIVLAEHLDVECEASVSVHSDGARP
ncbi:hypothetical protein [Glycomyces tenuis]|uniref:hypothetical protein n=1 Tax=Glycomyces tenuis TaxID=58116 RepID=UPI00047C418C|nr:hypothetical protein [Glycomyces tenuis]